MGCMNLRGGAKSLDMATVTRENRRNMDRLVQSSKRLEDQLIRLSFGSTITAVRGAFGAG